MSSPSPAASPERPALRMPPRPRGLAFALSILMLAIYLGFVLVVAFGKGFLGSLIVPGLSWGVLLGALVIVVAWVLTFIYVAASRTNSAK